MSWFKKKVRVTRSISVGIALRCGFLTPEKAQEADELLQKVDDECPTLGFLEQQGYLTEEQAEAVRKTRLEEDPVEAARQTIRRARSVQKGVEAKTGSLHISLVRQAQKA